MTSRSGAAGTMRPGDHASRHEGAPRQPRGRTQRPCHPSDRVPEAIVISIVRASMVVATLSGLLYRASEATTSDMSWARTCLAMEPEEAGFSSSGHALHLRSSGFQGILARSSLVADRFGWQRCKTDSEAVQGSGNK